MNIPMAGHKTHFKSATWDDCPLNGKECVVIECKLNDSTTFSGGLSVCIEFTEDSRRTWCKPEECQLNLEINDDDFVSTRDAGFLEHNKGRVFKDPLILVRTPGAKFPYEQAIGLLKKEKSVKIAVNRMSDLRNVGPEIRSLNHKYLEYARVNGCVMYWFPEDIVGIDLRRQGEALILELGHVCGLSRYSDSVIVVGVDRRSVYRELITSFMNDRFPMLIGRVFETLEEACETVISLPSFRHENNN